MVLLKTELKSPKELWIESLFFEVRASQGGQGAPRTGGSSSKSITSLSKVFCSDYFKFVFQFSTWSLYYKKAFSLIELLLVLVILGFISFIAVSNIGGVFAKNRSIAFADVVRSALKIARFSAIKFGEPVNFCGSSDGKKCDGYWQNGSIVITESGKVIRVFSKAFYGDRIVQNGSFAKNGVIVFLPEGFLKGGQQGSFYYCPKGYSKNALNIIINAVGRVKISNKNSKGGIISCNF